MLSSCRTVIFVVFVSIGFTIGEPISQSISTYGSGNNFVSGKTKNVTPMHKVLMTQRGYIQFLRWELPVPEIKEFTFCLWVKSTNLTYPHSIFSYSKDEKQRLVRSWISSLGKSIHLEINEVEIFAQTTLIEEHRWYHICQSWHNKDGRFALWIDGQKQIDGYSTKMAGHVIPSKGDIVLGQEYTDFDKGLEEGIEGAVLGFNLLLASAFTSTFQFFERNKLDDSALNIDPDLSSYDLIEPTQSYGARTFPRPVTEHAVFDRIPFSALEYSDQNFQNRRSTSQRILRRRNTAETTSRTKRKSNFGFNWGINSSTNSRPGEKSLGQELIDKSFSQCEQGRGSPRIGDKLMLISWTRTPVRVFGGAIVKNVNKSECGQF